MSALDSSSVVQWLCGNLAALRVARNLTQAQLGAEAGITRNHYQLLESGRAASGGVANPRLGTIAALADALGVEPAVLLMAPVDYTVWHWVDVRSGEVTENLEARILDELLTRLQERFGSTPAALVSHEEATLTAGVAVRAPDERSAIILAEALVRATLEAAGIDGALAGDAECVAGIEGLVSTDEV